MDHSPRLGRRQGAELDTRTYAEQSYQPTPSAFVELATNIFNRYLSEPIARFESESKRESVRRRKDSIDEAEVVDQGDRTMMRPLLEVESDEKQAHAEKDSEQLKIAYLPSPSELVKTVREAYGLFAAFIQAQDMNPQYQQWDLSNIYMRVQAVSNREVLSRSIPFIALTFMGSIAGAAACKYKAIKALPSSEKLLLIFTIMLVVVVTLNIAGFSLKELARQKQMFSESGRSSIDSFNDSLLGNGPGQHQYRQKEPHGLSEPSSPAAPQFDDSSQFEYDRRTTSKPSNQGSSSSSSSSSRGDSNSLSSSRMPSTSSKRVDRSEH